MSSTNTTTITATTTSTSSPSGVVAVTPVKNESYQSVGDGAPVPVPRPPQTNGISDVRVDLNVDVVDIQSQSQPVTNNTRPTTAAAAPRCEELELQYSSNHGGKKIDGNDSVKIHPCLLDGEVIDSSSSPSVPVLDSTSIVTPEGSPGPLPNFRVEGSGAGDSSVTVAVGVGVTGCNGDCPSGIGSGGESGSGGPNSEDMKLSLVSWYSEPGEERLMTSATSTASCCDGGGGGVGRQTLSLTNSLIGQGGGGGGGGGGSEEKENLTPEPSGVSISSSPLNLTNGVQEQNQDPLSAPQSLLDPDLGGSRESVVTLQGEEGLYKGISSPKPNNKTRGTKMVQLQEADKNCLNSAPNRKPKHTTSTSTDSLSLIGKPECSKCSRRSKSGHTMTTPTTSTTTHKRTPASRRLMPSNKSSSELKKPIKSILKSDSNSRSGSGSCSDNAKSSLDSLIENRCANYSTTTTTTPLRPPPPPSQLNPRSESGTSTTTTTTRAKFNLNHEIFSVGSSTTNTQSTGISSSEERIASKLKRIEKYATLRFRKGRVKPVMDLGSDSNIGAAGGSGSKVSTPTPTDLLMTKSMSFLEKGDPSSLPFYGGNGNYNSNSNSTNTTTALKRQGSLRMKKGSSPQWEPCTTKTTLLRMQKMQEAKAKQGGGGGSGVTNYGGGGGSGSGGGSVHTGSTHSGSGESIHVSQGHQGHGHGHGHGHSTPGTKMSGSAEKQKVFAKLSSALGQTASSNQKRLKQDKGIQTDQGAGGGDHQHHSGHVYFSHGTGSNATSMSPIPSVDTTADLLGQIKELEKLANRYRGTALRFQCEYEKSEEKIVEMVKLFKETQTESSEMIEFLQAEKSTLAESLSEVEMEAKQLRDQSDLADTRMAILARLGEGHKQQVAQSTDLLHRFEQNANAVVASFSNQISEGKNCIVITRQKVIALTECLIKAYKIPNELLKSFTDDGHGLSPGSLFLPLIDALVKAFPAASFQNGVALFENGVDKITTALKSASCADDSESGSSIPTQTQAMNDNDKGGSQDILKGKGQGIGLDQIKLAQLISSFPDVDDESNLTREVLELNASIGRLLLVIRVIVVKCNEQFTKVSSGILECLQSAEDLDTGSNIPEFEQVQKSMEVWRDNQSISHEKDSSYQNGNSSASTACVQNGQSSA